MCLTLPGKIISIKKNQAKVDLAGKTVNVKIVGTSRDLSLQKNDWVLVYGDLVVEKISQKEAEKIQELFRYSGN